MRWKVLPVTRAQDKIHLTWTKAAVLPMQEPLDDWPTALGKPGLDGVPRRTEDHGFWDDEFKASSLRYTNVNSLNTTESQIFIFSVATMSFLAGRLANTFSYFTGSRKQNVSRAAPLKVQAIAGDGARVDKFSKSDIM